MDNFIRNFLSRHYRLLSKSRPDYLLKLLSAIEYAEAILEITAAKIFGEKFKWFIVFLTHLTKCIIRLQLLIIHKIGMQTLPSLFSVKSILNTQTQLDTNNNSKPIDSVVKRTTVNNINSSNDFYFKLKHSGRVVRSIKNSPTNLDQRDWCLPITEQTIESDSSLSSEYSKQKRTLNNQVKSENDEKDVDFDPTKDNLRYLAEILHIMRPITHLGCILIFNSKSWTQFLVPLVFDSTSLFLMNGTKNMSKSQKKEMRRRSLLFFHYLIRSPFYEGFSSSIINVTLSQFEQHIPGIKFIIKPINEYIPYWRSIYNYCWTC